MQPPTSDAAELVMNSPIVETEQTHLSRDEHALMKELLRPGAKIEAVIPENATPEQLWDTLKACSHGLLLLETRVNRLKPIIGKILLIFEHKPSLYKDLGYETYSDFMRQGVYDKLGLHHTSAYEGKLAARDWPQLTPDRYVQIGPKKLNIISKFTKGSSPNAETWLEVASKMKVGELREYAEQRGFLQPGETVGATIMVQTNKGIYDHFKQFAGNPRVHEAVGSKDPGEILEAMLQECEGEWLETTERNNRAMSKEVGR